MPGGRIFTDVVTVGDIEVYNVTANPNGVLPARIGSWAFRSDAGNVGAWQNTDGATSWVAFLGSASPAGIITVAQGGGGDFLTITAGLAAAVAGQTVEVYPGIYNENIIIPSGVSLQAAGSPLSTRINGGAATPVTASDGTRIVGFGLIGPSAAVPTIDVTGLTSGGGGFIASRILITSGGALGRGIVGPGSGAMILDNVVYNAGTMASFIEHVGVAATSQTYISLASVLPGDGAVSTLTDIIKASGPGRLTILEMFVAAAAIITDGLEVGCNFQGQNILYSEQGNVANGLHITADGIEIDLSDSHLHATANDILVDPALTGAGSNVNLTFVDFENANTSIPSTWVPDLFISCHVDTGGSGDNPGIKFNGAAEFGTLQFPSSVAMGDGDSSVLGMVAYTYDDSAGTYTDVTTELRSESGSPATWNTDVNDALLIGFPSKPRMYDIENVAALVGGGNTVAVRVFTGAVLEDIVYMSADSDGSGLFYAKTVFQRPNGDENLRLGTDSTQWTNWATTDPPSIGTPMYWIWFQNTGVITSAPTVERVKVGDSYIEEKRTGTNRFGQAEQTRTFWTGSGEDLSTPSGGVNAPNNFDVTISPQVTYRQSKSGYVTGQDNRAGKQLGLPEKIDTSRPLIGTLRWTTDGTSVLPIDWEMYLSEVPAGATLNTVDVTQNIDAKSIAPTGTAQKVVTTTFSFDISELVPGSSFAVMLWRRGTVDTNPDTAGALTIALSATFID